MFKKIIATILVAASLFTVAANAATHSSTSEKAKVNSLFGTSLYVHNYSNTVVRVTERYSLPFDVMSNGGYYSLHTDWFDDLYDVGFYYLTVYGTYYPVPNCFSGNLYSDMSVTIRDTYVNGYLVPTCVSY